MLGLLLKKRLIIILNGTMFSIKAKNKPKWHQLRKKLASSLVSLARKIDPVNDDAAAFWMEKIYKEMALYGSSVVRVEWDEETND